jgi:hypothetical protein
MPDQDIPRLVAALGSADVAQRSEAAQQLARLGGDAQEAALPLVRASVDPADEVCEWVAAALEELGPPPSADVPELATLLVDPQAEIGYWAATLLGRLREEAAPAVAALAGVLAEPVDVTVRQRAAWALGQIGVAASAALDALRKASTDENPRLARLAQRAIEQIGD